MGQTTNSAVTTKEGMYSGAFKANHHGFIPFAFDTFLFLAPEAIELLWRVQKVMDSNFMTTGSNDLQDSFMLSVGLILLFKKDLRDSLLHTCPPYLYILMLIINKDILSQRRRRENPYWHYNRASFTYRKLPSTSPRNYCHLWYHVFIKIWKIHQLLLSNYYRQRW